MATKVKITRNVIINSQLLKAGEVHELEDVHADHLLEGEHAVEHKSNAKPPTEPGGVIEELMAKTKEELIKIVDARNDKKPNSITLDLGKANKLEIATQIAKDAGYKVT